MLDNSEYISAHHERAHEYSKPGPIKESSARRVKAQDPSLLADARVSEFPTSRRA